MISNYPFCLKEVLKSEGGYTNDPRDPGGPTNFGITIIDYRKYINSSGTAEDVKNMTVDQAKTIYKSKYWDAMGCDNLPSGVDYTVFDYGVNSGVGRAKKVLAQFAAIKDPVQMINAINDERLAFLKRLKTWSTFGRGWGPRVERVRNSSIRLAKQPTIGAEHGTAGAVIIAGAAVANNNPHHWPWILLGTAIVAVISYVIIKAIKKESDVTVAPITH